MPRRNESGRERKRSSGPGRSTSGRDRAGKSFRKSSRGDQGSQEKRVAGRSYSKPLKKSTRDSGRSSKPFETKRAPKSGGRSYRDSDSGSFRSGASRGAGRGSQRKQSSSRSYGESSEDKGLSRKSRFASDKPKTNRAPRTSEGARPPSRNRPRTTEGGGKPRGASFGKPYKKTYRPKPERENFPARKKTGAEEATPKSDKIRLNKFIANSGIASRREADGLITMGLISVNGTVITELGYKINPGDEVRYEDRVLRPEKPVYILMNKPKGFLTTTDDPQERKTVMHIIGSSVKERIYPVGRLDRNTTGLLLLTNDGDLADKLMHPSFNVKKVYKVELDKALTKNDFQAILDGVRLEEGRAIVDDLAIVSDDGRTVGIELHIGWNRVVRRIFESLGYEVVKLDRTAYAGLDKKELGRGQWRFLTREEIIHLKHFN